MTLTRIVDQWFRIVTSCEEGRWMAHASRGETGDRFGPGIGGATEAEAVAGLTRWLEWQAEHSALLGRLQAAERRYHLSVTSSAFGSLEEEAGARERRAAALGELDAARRALDAVRGRRPEYTVNHLSGNDVN